MVNVIAPEESVTTEFILFWHLSSRKKQQQNGRPSSDLASEILSPMYTSFLLRVIGLLNYDHADAKTWNLMEFHKAVKIPILWSQRGNTKYDDCSVPNRPIPLLNRIKSTACWSF